MSHSVLEGHVINGNHAALISEKLFFQANEILKETKVNVAGYKQKKENDNIPLKHFVYCSECGTPFTGYIVKSKNLYYYKCNKIGCKCNKSARHLHERFEQLLSRYETKKPYLPVLRGMLMETYTEIVDQSQVSSKELKTKLKEIKQKADKVEERYAHGEIDRGIYEKISSKLKGEMAGLIDGLDQSRIILSNPLEVVNKTLEITSNLNYLWVSGGSEQKKNLQNLLFPVGIQYDRKIDHYRTKEVNPLLLLTHSFSEGLEENKNGQREREILTCPV
jgi:site-specific DNA recombinase